VVRFPQCLLFSGDLFEKGRQGDERRKSLQWSADVLASYRHAYRALTHPQAWRSMCGWIGNGILAASPRR
jgi:hypothetical protein